MPERKSMYHGMLTIYKEKGYTSSDAVARLRGILRMRKIGHTGTLDPDAEGVLPMCLGNATRICELIADRDKEYVAVMRLGVTTDTQDMSGTVLREMPAGEAFALLAGPDAGDGSPCGTPARVDEDAAADALPDEAADRQVRQRILEAAAGFVGEIDQIPPMYSAVKINGKRLYDMARKGITVERKARRITIHALTVEKIDFPLVTMRVRCSKGTYIRTLCHDLGELLGTGAAMESLLRTRVGQFALDEAVTLDEVERIAKTDPGSLPGLIRPVDAFFADLPAAACAPDALRLLKNGNLLEPSALRFLSGDEDPQSGAASHAAEGEKSAGTVDTPAGGPGHEADGPFAGAGEVIRVYGPDLAFYGLYHRTGRRRAYSAYKMFLPQQ